MKRRVAISLFTGLLASFLFMLFSGLSEAREVSDNVLRLHIMAASDSKEDQEIKFAARDSVLSAGKTMFSDAKDREDALRIARDNEKLIVSAAQRAVRKANKDDGVSFTIGERYFPTRIYDGGLRLPAGRYNAVTLSIGEGKGQNWWCVMYPALCVSGSIGGESPSVDDVLCGGALSLIRYPAPANVEIKFKLVEWFETLKQRIFGGV